MSFFSGTVYQLRCYNILKEMKYQRLHMRAGVFPFLFNHPSKIVSHSDIATLQCEARRAFHSVNRKI